MRKTSRLILIVIIAAAGLAACKGDNKSSPTSLDAPFQNATTAAPRSTSTPWPTPWSTNTPEPVAARATASPYPTPGPDATEEPLPNVIVPGDWLRAPFLDENGEEHTLQEFQGRAVVVQTLSALCELCMEQQRNILLAVQDRYDYGGLPDTVFLALGVVEGESASLIRSSLQNTLGEQWATVELLEQADVPADYMVGTASKTLRDALARDFGPDILAPVAVPVFVIQPDGLAHLAPEGLMNEYELRDIITFYSNPPASAP